MGPALKADTSPTLPLRWLKTRVFVRLDLDLELYFRFCDRQANSILHTKIIYTILGVALRSIDKYRKIV